jgi:hypothetical protein
MIEVTANELTVNGPEAWGTLAITSGEHSISFMGRLTGEWLVDGHTGDRGYADVRMRFVSTGSVKVALARVIAEIGDIEEAAALRRNAEQTEFLHDLIRAAHVAGRITEDAP